MLPSTSRTSLSPIGSVGKVLGFKHSGIVRAAVAAAPPQGVTKYLKVTDAAEAHTQIVILASGGTFTMSSPTDAGSGPHAYDVALNTLDTASTALIRSLIGQAPSSAMKTGFRFSSELPGTVTINDTGLTGGATGPTAVILDVILGSTARAICLVGVTGGTFTVTSAGFTSAPIAWNANAATVQAAIRLATGGVEAIHASSPAGGPYYMSAGGVATATVSGSGLT